MYAHETQVRVLYAHTDKAGVVYYANYLVFFETGRTEYFRMMGKSYSDFEKEGILLTVVEAHCRYLAPAFYDDLLTIRTCITGLRRTKVHFTYKITSQEGKLVCEGETVLGCLDSETRRPRELPAEMMRQIKGLISNNVEK